MRKYLTYSFIKKSLLYFLAFFVSVTVLWVLILSFINPPITFLMLKRSYQQLIDSKREVYFSKEWVSIENISPNMVQAVVASEDNKFLTHFGFDMEAIRKANHNNKKGRKVRGASTISQQTAKNVFLWPTRSYVRKVFEMYFTVLIEVFWSKERVMEVYLNIIEFGDGVYGVEAASRKYFNKSAKKLTRGEAALLAAILPSPLKRNPAKPSSYLLRRQAHILSLMEKIGPVDFK